MGRIPSGSKYPLALRRAGIGITRIAWEQNWTLSFEALVDLGLKAVASRAAMPHGETREALLSFFKDRVAYRLEVTGYAGAVRRSALATGWADLMDLKARCEALLSFLDAVMVKCEDAALRNARLSLLHRLRKAFLKVADFSLWQQKPRSTRRNPGKTRSAPPSRGALERMG